jgi:transcriptional regulator with XRE-family HTH domain
MSILLASGMRPPEHGAAPASHIHGVMTDAEYEAAKAEFLATYGASNAEAAALRDQAMAKLFACSGWTQEKLAEKEGKSRQWIVQRLCFGQFLNFATAVANLNLLPNNFTEWKFRGYWEQTDKDEHNNRIRYQQVLEMIREDIRIGKSTKTKGHAKIIREHFADGQWHPLSEIAEKIGTTEQDAMQRLRDMKKLSIDLETRLRGRDQHTECRIFPREKTVSVSELAEKLGPLIKSLKAEGKKSMAAMVPANVAMFADLLQRLLDEWTASPE